jgi:hypothetical protein
MDIVIQQNIFKAQKRYAAQLSDTTMMTKAKMFVPKN